MRSISTNAAAAAIENGGQPRPSTDKNVRAVANTNDAAITFKDLARFAWPYKTEAHLSHLTGYDARTCRRWLAGGDPPAEALGVILQEILRRYHQR